MRLTALIGGIVTAVLVSFAFQTDENVKLAVGAFSDPYLPIQGGTGTSTTPAVGDVLVGQSDGTYAPQATSTLGISGSSGGGSGTSTVYLASTTPWTNGNLAYVTGSGTVGSVATGTLTETVTGLELSANRALVGGSAILSLTSGYLIASSSDFSNWNNAFAWGNHASSSYLSTTTGDWIGTFDGQEGTYYLSRANHTGTQLSNTISDLTATIQSLSVGTTTNGVPGEVPYWTGTRTLGSTATGTLTETITGLELSANRYLLGGSAILALTAGYNIPLSASTTEWSNFYATPSTRITAGNGLEWSGNTLSATNTHNPVTLSGALDYITLVGQDIVRAAIDLATDITGVLPIANGGTGATTLNDLITLATHTTGNFIATITGTANEITVSGSGSENAGVTLSLPSSLNLQSKTVKLHTYKSFSFPTFATTTSATTTIDLGTAYTAESWSGADCYTSSGSAAYIFTDGTNRMNGTTATTTVSTLTLSTNNTFTAKEKRYVEIGPLTSAKLVCTVDIIVNN